MKKGVILAGGTGSRLYPLTKVTNKHLLPIYNKPMIFYPLNTLIKAGITDILIVSGRGHAGHFLDLLGSGKEFGVRINYEVQEEAGGIAQALALAEDFVDNQKFIVILGDNIFEDNFEKEVDNFFSSEFQAKIFLKDVPDPQRFGVAKLAGNKIESIEEKPERPRSNLAVTGLYLYDSSVFDVIRKLKPSNRGEYEITDVNNHYVNLGKMSYSIVDGFWSDAGSFESLFRASSLIRKKSPRTTN